MTSNIENESVIVSLFFVDNACMRASRRQLLGIMGANFTVFFPVLIIHVAQYFKFIIESSKRD